MPPASRGITSRLFRNGLVYTSRPVQFQRRFLARPPSKPTLPPADKVRAAVAARIEEDKKEKQRQWQAKREEDEKQSNKKQRGLFSRIAIQEWLRRLYSRLALPPAASRLLKKFSPPAWFRRMIWSLFFVAPPLTVLIMTLPLNIMPVQGPSMAPFLNVHSSVDEPAPNPDWLVVQKVDSLNLFGLLPKRRLERGQVVVFYAPHDPKKLAVKRVVGLPGDRITPLPGYPGGDDLPVVIPFNHIWVEGDANDRKKSIDSNHFGPISQNMVYGFVLQVWSSWWKWPVPAQWEQDDYPAKKDGRVEKDVVKSAKLDPDAQDHVAANPFTSGAAALELAMMKQHREQIPRKMQDRRTLARYRSIYALASAEAATTEDAVIREVATGLVEELEIAFECVGLSKDGSRLAPVVQQRTTAATAPDKEEKLRAYLAKQQRNS